MANIIEMYQRYQEQFTSNMLRDILKRVTQEFLRISENIPEDVAFENFEKGNEGEFVDIGIENPENGCISVGFGLYEVIGYYPYDDTLIKEMNSFIEKFYPGLKCTNPYTLHLPTNRVIFIFSFDAEERFNANSKVNESDYLEKLQTLNSSVKRLREDVSKILKHNVTEKDWEWGEDMKYTLKDGTESDLIEVGQFNLNIPIDSLMNG